MKIRIGIAVLACLLFVFWCKSDKGMCWGGGGGGYGFQKEHG